MCIKVSAAAVGKENWRVGTNCDGQTNLQRTEKTEQREQQELPQIESKLGEMSHESTVTMTTNSKTKQEHCASLKV